MDSKELKKQLEKAKADLEAFRAKKLQAITQATSGDTKAFAVQERKAVAKWGVKSLNELLHINSGDRKYSYMSTSDKESVKNLKEAVDITMMVAARFKKAPQDTKAFGDLITPAVKALGIEVGEQGAEWVPTMISSSYIDEYNLERKVSSLFQEIKMPSNPYEFPVLSNGAVATKLAERTQKTVKDEFTASTISFSAVKLSNQYELPEELNEDSAVDVMKVIRQELIEGQEKALEIAILEGDTDGTHQHTTSQFGGAVAADSSETVFDGLRKRALNAAASALKVDCGAALINEGHLSQARQKMKKFGVNSQELALICGPIGYNQLLQLDDVRTLEQYGPQAPVLSGELAKYEGIPVIVSEWLREDTDATGINGAVPANNTKKSMILVNRKRFFLGMRRPIQVKVENYRTSFDVWDMVSFSRRAFQGILKADSSNAASEQSAVLLYNIL
jgi:HK97 family phage major capsid protein